jgi:NADPH:quinone reductase-like Zn-dependent oxidoreductase
MTSSAANLPASSRQLQSTLAADGSLTLAITERPVRQPGPGEVLLRVEAAPLNPSDLMTTLASADPSTGSYEGSGEARRAVLQLTPGEAAARSSRIGMPVAPGLACAGTAIAAGEGAEALIGRTLAALSLTAGTYGEYVTLATSDCAALPEGITARQGADVFCNPMTALSIVEEVRLAGQSALVHTAAASNLGLMLVRICKEDGVGLVNIVRREEQAQLLRSLGAEHVCVSSAHSFDEDLRAAIAATGATIAFDAIGGGLMPGALLGAFEDVAAARLGYWAPYGSPDDKRVLIYGRLDEAPLVLDPSVYGMIWRLEHWYMGATLARIDPARVGAMRERVLAGITTTFASDFAREIPLSGLLDPETLIAAARQSTGGKVLVNPTL